MKISIATSIILTLVLGSSLVPAAEKFMIDENSAKNLAIEKYNYLFKNKYFLNPVDSKYYAYPKLESNYLKNSKMIDCCWLLEGEPPAGIYIVVKVDKQGKWVDFSRVGFASD